MAFDAAALWWPPFQKLYTQVRRSVRSTKGCTSEMRGVDWAFANPAS